MGNNQFEVADIFVRHGDQYCKNYGPSPQQFKVFNLIKACRTAALGGHIQLCAQMWFLATGPQLMP